MWGGKKDSYGCKRLAAKGQGVFTSLWPKSQEVLGLRASSLDSQPPCVDVASLLSLHSGLVLSPILFFSIRSQAIFITLFSNLHWAGQPSYRKLPLAIYLTFFPQDPIGSLALEFFFPPALLRYNWPTTLCKFKV